MHDAICLCPFLFPNHDDILSLCYSKQEGPFRSCNAAVHGKKLDDIVAMVEISDDNYAIFALIRSCEKHKGSTAACTACTVLLIIDRAARPFAPRGSAYS